MSTGSKSQIAESGILEVENSQETASDTRGVNPESKLPSTTEAGPTGYASSGEVLSSVKSSSKEIPATEGNLRDLTESEEVDKIEPDELQKESCSISGTEAPQAGDDPPRETGHYVAENISIPQIDKSAEDVKASSDLSCRQKETPRERRERYKNMSKIELKTAEVTETCSGSAAEKSSVLNVSEEDARKVLIDWINERRKEVMGARATGLSLCPYGHDHSSKDKVKVSDEKPDLRIPLASYLKICGETDSSGSEERNVYLRNVAEKHLVDKEKLDEKMFLVIKEMMNTEPNCTRTRVMNIIDFHTEMADTGGAPYNVPEHYDDIESVDGRILVKKKKVECIELRENTDAETELVNIESKSSAEESSEKFELNEPSKESNVAESIPEEITELKEVGTKPKIQRKDKSSGVSQVIKDSKFHLSESSPKDEFCASGKVSIPKHVMKISDSQSTDIPGQMQSKKQDQDPLPKFGRDIKSDEGDDLNQHATYVSVSGKGASYELLDITDENKKQDQESIPGQYEEIKSDDKKEKYLGLHASDLSVFEEGATCELVDFTEESNLSVFEEGATCELVDFTEESEKQDKESAPKRDDSAESEMS